MAIQLKVKRTELLDRLKVARKNLSEGFSGQLAAYEKERKKQMKAATKALRARIAKGDISLSRYGAKVEVTNVKLKLDKPSKPSSSKLTVLDEQIRNLELATNDILTISDKSDYFRYL